MKIISNACLILFYRNTNSLSFCEFSSNLVVGVFRQHQSKTDNEVENTMIESINRKFKLINMNISNVLVFLEKHFCAYEFKQISRN